MELPVVVWWWSWSNCFSGWCRWCWQKRCFPGLLGLCSGWSWVLHRWGWLFLLVWSLGAVGLLEVCRSFGLLRWLSLILGMHFLAFGTGIHDGLAWLWVDGLGMHLKWSCNDGVSVLCGEFWSICMVSIWNGVVSIGSYFLVFSLPPFMQLCAVLSHPWGWGVGLLSL